MLNILSLFSGIGAFEKALTNVNVKFNLAAELVNEVRQLFGQEKVTGQHRYSEMVGVRRIES